MLKNYLTIAWRSLTKNRLYSLVNIGGLSIGLTCCILIGLYLSNELSYDRFHKNAGRLVRVTTEYSVNGVVSQDGTTGSMAGPRLATAFPQIESYVRIRSFDPYVVRYGEKTFVEKRFLFADSTFFSLFSFPLVEGDPLTALNAPNKIVISRSMERKYFGDEQGLGRTLRIGGTKDYVVSGVALDAPTNSQIQFNFIASYSSLANANMPNWWVDIYSTYFLLRDPRDRAGLEKGIAAYMRDQKDRGQALHDYLTFHLEPITRVHLYSSLNGPEPNGNINYVYILGAIALMILCIACVNYTNLATVQSTQRVSEIGIRKVLGSAKWQLFGQFIGESLLLNLLAFLLAVLVAVLALPLFNRLVDQPLNAHFLAGPLAIGCMLCLYLAISVTAGVYPAFIVSRPKLIRILKTGFSFSGKTGVFRKSLIVFQFMVSVFLIIATVVIFQQLSYIQHKDLGYDKDHLLVLPVDEVMRDHLLQIQEAIRQVPNIRSVSCGTEDVDNIQWNDELRTTLDGSTPPLLISAAPTDIDFVRTIGLQLVAGSDYSRSDWEQTDSALSPSPHTSFLLNESAVKALGWTPAQAIGRTLYRSTQKGIVKGVLKDFHFAPLHQGISPLVIFLDGKRYEHIFQVYVKVSGADIPGTLRALEAVWKERVPHRPFQYHFLEDNYNVLYHSEQQTARIFSTFATLAVLLAGLGLFALAAYTTVQRAKEIGIRKVLGAGTLQIVALLSVDFLKLVALASLIAFPLAWVSMSRWLDSFAYRIPVNGWIFLLAGLASSMVALLTVGLQAVKVASANPMKSLKSE